MSDDGPRCPLGFKGTPPAGHPSIPGLTSSKQATTSVPTDSKSWSPNTLLILDAVFLILCVAIAWWFPEIKKALGVGESNKRLSAEK